MTEPIEPGDAVVLDDGDGNRSLVRVPGPDETVQVEGVGVLAGSLFEGEVFGGRLDLGRRSFRILPVTPSLAFETLERGAQIIRPVDAARIAHALGVGPGTTVVEGGVGSGALTTYLAFLVGEEGTVHGYDVREDHLSIARRNVERLGLADRVTFHEGDLAEAEPACGAFVADVPDPAPIVEAAQRCLVPGGRVCFYNPLVSQVEAAREALARHAFGDTRTIEQLERDWVVHDRGSRPAFDMLGHTGFMTFATRIVPDG